MTVARRSRGEHLAWCRERAIQVLETGNCAGAVASMVSDLREAETPLYDEAVLLPLLAEGIVFRRTPAAIRRWIEGFR